MRFAAIIFDFDGVLIESEYVGNKQIADYLTAAGHPTSVEESMNNFMGLAGHDFIAAIEGWIGGPLPEDFHDVRSAEDRRVLDEGLEAVAGAVTFIRALPPTLPKAIASSGGAGGAAGRSISCSAPSCVASSWGSSASGESDTPSRCARRHSG